LLVAALREALQEAQRFCEARDIDLSRVARAQGFERIGCIDDAVEALLRTDGDKKRYVQLAGRVARLFKAILPDPMANELAPMAILVVYLAAKIRAETEQPDISAVMGDIESLLNDSIATEGYRIGPPSNPAQLVNLSEIDFAALHEKFASGRKHTEAEKLRRLIEGKLVEMMRLNPARVDFADKFQKLIDEYNSGSRNVEELFAELVKFARQLTAEEQRGVAEGLSEEELALFDILTKPEPVLAKKEVAEVKKVCRELLASLKREKLVLDWREKQQARAGVMQTIKLELRRLPTAFDKDVRSEKLARTYAHIYDHYFGSGASTYAPAS
jgi:type I restriction enzyme R subunit